MQLHTIILCALILPACTSQQQYEQSSLGWTQELTIADYRDRAHNAPSSVVSDVWIHLISTQQWCSDLSQNSTRQSRCQSEIDQLRGTIVELRLGQETLCDDFVERNKCTQEVVDTLDMSSRKIINAGETLRIAQDQ